MKIMSGVTAAALKIGEPQAEQKFRWVSPPWSSPVVVNEERAPFDVERPPRHDDHHGERAAGLALAVRAVADSLGQRIRVGAVGHAPAQTAASDWLRHASHIGVKLHEMAWQRA